ncbi:hypothetical protein TNCV_1619001 [Trichonephila clavipes]|nr:hypothetical protein TNCV_1619001 [Trichonephila clavipes]
MISQPNLVSYATNPHSNVQMFSENKCPQKSAPTNSSISGQPLPWSETRKEEPCPGWRRKNPDLDRENRGGKSWLERTGREPWWRELEESAKEKDLVRDWSGKEGKTMNDGDVEE